MAVDTRRLYARLSNRVDPALLQLQETLRRLDMRLKAPRSSPEELDAMLAAFHGAQS